MKTRFHPLIGVAALMAAAVLHLPQPASQPGAKTREEVKAELAEAQRTGEFILDYEGFRKANEVYPTWYPQRPASGSR